MKIKSKAAGLTGWFGLLAVLCVTRVLAMEAAAAGEDQAGDTAGDSARARTSDPAMDEITVTGQRSMLNLRLQKSEAEDVMYGLYNELNTDDQYDIVCTTDTRVFSHIKEKTCLPVYAREALMDEAQSRAQGMQGQSAILALPLKFVLASEYPGLESKFKEMVEKSPELFNTVAKHYELMEQLRLRRKTYFGKDE